MTSPSDMWLADMDLDGLMDVCGADHTAHRGFWHKNPGIGEPGPWKPNMIFRNIRLPGDFAMTSSMKHREMDGCLHRTRATHWCGSTGGGTLPTVTR